MTAVVILSFHQVSFSISGSILIFPLSQLSTGVYQQNGRRSKALLLREFEMFDPIAFLRREWSQHCFFISGSLLDLS
jgi:hypothetical protein